MKVTIHCTAGIVLLTAATISLSTPQKVEAKEWNMCAWEEIPRSVMKRIVQRSDYADMMTIWALRLWVRLIPFHAVEVYENRARL